MARTPLPLHADANAGDLPAAIRRSAGFLVKQLSDLFRLRFEAVLRTQQLHPRQYLLMQVLRDEGPTAQQSLGGRVGMDRTTTMQAVQRLADAGLVVRADDPADRRVYRVELTAKGREVVTALEGRIQEAEAQLLAPLGEQGAEGFKAEIRAVLARTTDRCDERGGG